MKVRPRIGARSALALWGLLAGGCSPAPPQDVTVHWLLADGRSCLDAAVLSIIIRVSDSAPSGGSVITIPCPTDARTAGLLLIPALTPGVQLQARGLSSSDSVLYRGQRTVPDPVPPALDLTLYFTGGQ